MEKIGLKNVNLSQITAGLNLKKDLLYFDKVIINEPYLELSIEEFKYFEPVLKKGKRYERMIEGLNNLDYLVGNGMVEVEGHRNLYELVSKETRHKLWKLMILESRETRTN